MKINTILLLAALMIFLTLTFSAPAFAQDETLEVLNDTSISLYEQGKYNEAAELAERALKTAENIFGTDNPNVAPFLNNLAVIYYAQGRYAEAEAQYERAIGITQSALGPDHPRVKSLREGLQKCKQKPSEPEQPEESGESDEIAEQPDSSLPKEPESVQAPTDVSKPLREVGSAGRLLAEKLYTVQVGAFKNLLNARSIQDKLEKNGYDSSITSVTAGNGETLHKVQVGAFSERKKAQVLAREIGTLIGLDTFITTK